MCTQDSEKPTALYYEYNSFTERFALFEARTGEDGTQMVYLKPVEVSGDCGELKMIKGVILPAGSDMPDEAFVFDRLDAKISPPKLIVPDYWLWPWECSIL